MNNASRQNSKGKKATTMNNASRQNSKGKKATTMNSLKTKQ